MRRRRNAAPARARRSRRRRATTQAGPRLARADPGRIQWRFPIARSSAAAITVNGLTLLLLLALAIGIVVAWRAGVMRGRRDIEVSGLDALRPAVAAQAPSAAGDATPAPSLPPPVAVAANDPIPDEQARLVRALAAENAALRSAAAAAAAEYAQLRDFAEDRRRLLHEVATARAETARFRALVVDIENNALPPLLDGPNAPDDLKLIVGVGPVLERMLHQLGVATYRQIARWSERDIDEFDAKLAEFPGRIRRDAWVAQARALHQSKFGEALPTRER
jgi:predicted flap endonuclease-1-like 5' DNA nuclease